MVCDDMPKEFIIKKYNSLYDKSIIEGVKANFLLEAMEILHARCYSYSQKEMSGILVKIIDTARTIDKTNYSKFINQSDYEYLFE